MARKAVSQPKAIYGEIYKTTELTEAYEHALQLAMSDVSDEGEISEGLSQALTATQLGRERHYENMLRLLINLEAESKGLKDEENILAERRKRLEKAVSRLRAFWLSDLQRTGETKVETRLGSIIRQRSVPSVIIADEDVQALPAKFKRITIEADKKAILTAFRNNEKLPASVMINDTRETVVVKR